MEAAASASGGGNNRGLPSRHGRTMSLFAGRKILLAFVLALLLLSAVGLVSYHSLNQLVETTRSRTQTLHLFFRLQELEKHLGNAHIWQGLYSDKRQENSAIAFHEEARQAQNSLQALRDLTAADSRQQLNLASLEPLVEKRLAGLTELIELQRGNALTPEAQAERGQSGEKLDKDIRETVGNMKALELVLQGSRERDTLAGATATTWVLFVGYLLALLLGGGATLLADREMAVRKRAQDDLRRALDELELRIQERTTELATANAALRAEQERLQILSRQLLHAQETERRRIARELHDEIGQVLTAVKINLQTLQRTAGPAAHASLQESIAIVDRAVQQVRNLSLDLRPSLLDDLGLVAALRWYVDRQSARAGYHGQVVADPPDLTVPPEVATTCFRVAQEALTNVVRHAKAKRVRVELGREDGELRLVVRDDGTGFEVAAANRRVARGASLGLLGMQERVQLVGGRLELKSAPGAGTEVRVHLPLTPPADDEKGV
jgi:signal transduction histidine kinase